MESNNSSNLVQSTDLVKNKNDFLPTISFFIHLIFSVFGLLTNLFVFYMVLLKRCKTRKYFCTVQILICHLAMLSICEMSTKYVNTGEDQFALNVPGSLCSLVSYLRSKLYNKEIEIFSRYITGLHYITPRFA